MISHICDVCQARCDKSRLVIKDMEIWYKGVGKNVGVNVDLCTVSCFRTWFNAQLNRSSFALGTKLSVVDEDL